MAKRNGVPKITKAWLEWARQRRPCSSAMERLSRPGATFADLRINDVIWLRVELHYDGIDYYGEGYPWPLVNSDEAQKLAIRIAREVEIVDV